MRTFLTKWVISAGAIFVAYFIFSLSGFSRFESSVPLSFGQALQNIADKPFSEAMLPVILGFFCAVLWTKGKSKTK